MQIDLNLQEKGDHLVRALALDGYVRLTALRSTQTVEAARAAHDLSPLSTVALGRFMGGLQLLSMDLKNEEDSITGTIKSDGDLRGLTAVVKQNADIKGYTINTKVPSYYKEGKESKFDVHRAVGNGVLTIVREQAGAKPYSGSTNLISGEIAEDFTYYMAVSEQIPTVMGLGVLVDAHGVKHAGGYLVQLLPGASDEVITYLENRIAGFPDVTYLMEEGFSPAQILDLLMGDPDIQYLETKSTRFSCDCNHERILSIVHSLSMKDINELREEGNGVDIVCEFCNTTHHVRNEELDEIVLTRAQGIQFTEIEE